VFAFTKKEYFELMSKLYVIDSKISSKMQILEDVKKQISHLQSYEINGSDNKLIIFALEPIPHHLT